MEPWAASKASHNNKADKDLQDKALHGRDRIVRSAGDCSWNTRKNDRVEKRHDAKQCKGPMAFFQAFRAYEAEHQQGQEEEKRRQIDNEMGRSKCKQRVCEQFFEC